MECLLRDQRLMSTSMTTRVIWEIAFSSPLFCMKLASKQLLGLRFSEKYGAQYISTMSLSQSAFEVRLHVCNYICTKMRVQIIYPFISGLSFHIG